jgi:TRAP-type uncharacterized transport system substrate-binding protein
MRGEAAVAHKYLSEDLVYQIVKTTFEHRVELMKAHPVAKETIPENIERNTLFLLLPGALRYYREKGMAVAVEQTNRRAMVQRDSTCATPTTVT